MRYMIHIDWYVSGSGYSHTDVLGDFDHCDDFFPAERAEAALADDDWFDSEDEGDWHNVVVTFYNDDADPLFDDPIKTVESCPTIGGPSH